MNARLQPLPFSLGVLALALASTGLALPQEAPSIATVRPATEGNRAPYEVAFTADGALALVTEYDEGALALIDRATGKVLRHVPTGGQEPTGVAVASDAKLALVTNSFSGSLAFVDLQAFKTETLRLPGMPWDVVLSPDGKTAYVSVSQLDQVAVIDVDRRQVVARVPTGRRPRALAITPDGRVVVTANMTEGSVTFIDTASRASVGKGPTPAVNLRGVAVYPNGRLAYCVGQRAQNERPTEVPLGIWSNQSFHVVPNGGRNGLDNIWLDLVGNEVSDPDSVVFDPQGRRAFITCSGSHALNVVPLRGSLELKVVSGVGAYPRGLAFTPDGKEVWVANNLGNDLAVVDPETLRVTRRISLGPTARKDPHLAGRFLFNSATIVKGGQFSCNSCHPDGTTDGISWKFTHVPDALGREITRNVRSLRGEIGDTGPFRWTGHDTALEAFVQHETVGLLQSPKMEEAQFRQIADYIRSLPLPPNPHRQEDGSFTDTAKQGKLLFEGKAGCVSCHAGPKAGGGRKVRVGTTPPGLELDVPHLAGVYDSYPYLHDGRAATLEEIFQRHNEEKLHGSAHTLTAEELKALLEYVREL